MELPDCARQRSNCTLNLSSSTPLRQTTTQNLHAFSAVQVAQPEPRCVQPAAQEALAFPGSPQRADPGAVREGVRGAGRRRGRCRGGQLCASRGCQGSRSCPCSFQGACSRACGCRRWQRCCRHASAWPGRAEGPWRGAAAAEAAAIPSSRAEVGPCTLHLLRPQNMLAEDTKDTFAPSVQGCRS